MDNMYQPPGGDPQDYLRTDPLRPAAGPAGQGRAGLRGSGRTPRGSQPCRRPRRHRAVRWGTGIALAALLAGGGGIAAAQLMSNPSTTGPTGQAAVLNTALNSPNSAAALSTAAGRLASSAGGSSARRPAPCLRAARALYDAGHPLAARIALHACRRRLLRLRILAGLHGQFTFETPSGPRTLAFERGVIESATSGAIVVRALDGTTWTWHLFSNTVVRENRQQVSSSALKIGEDVFAGGPVLSGAYDARLIVIRPAAWSPAGGSPASGSS
jgi:hypothetical protein